MGSCFPGLSSLLCSPVVCKYSLRYLVFVKFLYCIKKQFVVKNIMTLTMIFKLKVLRLYIFSASKNGWAFQ